jgi:hypothetical protein
VGILLSGVNTAIDINAVGVEQYISLATATPAIAILVKEILKLRVDFGLLQEKNRELEKGLRLTDYKGKKGYQRLKRSIKNGSLAMTRRIGEALTRQEFKEGHNDVYLKGLGHLVEYAAALDAAPSEISSARESELSARYETDSDERYEEPAVKIAKKKEPEKEPKKPERRIFQVKSRGSSKTSNNNSMMQLEMVEEGMSDPRTSDNYRRDSLPSPIGMR